MVNTHLCVLSLSCYISHSVLISHFPVAMIKGKIGKKRGWGFVCFFAVHWFLFLLLLLMVSKGIDNDEKDMAAGAESTDITSHLYTGNRQNRTWDAAIRRKALLGRYFLHLVSTSSWFHSLYKQHRQLELSVHISLWGMCLIQTTTQSYNRFF